MFVAGVLSVLLYGCECWWLDSSARSKVGAWNARRLAVLTGRTIKEEYQEPTRDVVKMARHRRLTWLGKVLNRDSESVVTQFIITSRRKQIDIHVMVVRMVTSLMLCHLSQTQRS